MNIALTTLCFLPFPSSAYPLVTGELESLMYTLIFWACEGQLVWSWATKDVHRACSAKRDAMIFTFEVRLH